MPKQILVIDDDVTVQDIFTSFLGLTYKVRGATTGKDAVLKLRCSQVDLVVLDHRLPDRTGLDMLPELRSIRPGLPVIMVTGYGSEWLCATAFKLGVADYLQKPVNPVDLLGAVRRVLSPGLEESPASYESAMPRGLSAALCIPVHKVMGLIQQRYWDHLSLSEMADQVGMSKYRLSHRFREVLGITFRDYLLTVRLERAKALLAARHTSITEIAQTVGFSDLPRFDKAFKRYSGLTPSAYRSSASRPTNK